MTSKKSPMHDTVGIRYIGMRVHTFLHAVTFARRAMGGKDCAPSRQQLLVDVNNGKATIVCTDGHRMHLAEFECEGQASVHIPALLLDFVVGVLTTATTYDMVEFACEPVAAASASKISVSIKEKEKHWICSYPDPEGFPDFRQLLKSLPKPSVTFMCTSKTIRNACQLENIAFKKACGKVWLGSGKENHFEFVELPAFDRMEVLQDADVLVHANSAYVLDAVKSSLGATISLSDGWGPVIIERYCKAELGIKEWSCVMPLRP